MRAVVHAPHVPTRLLASLVGLAATGLALAVAVGVLVGVSAAVSLGLLSMTFAALALVRPFGFRTRTLTIDTEPGRVHLRRAIGGVTIDRRDVVGATTCHHEGRVAMSLTVSVWRGTTTVTLSFDDEASAERVRAALGLPREGAGETCFAVSPSMVDTTTRVVSGFVAFGSLLAFLTPVEPGSAAFHELYAYVYGGPALVFALILSLVGHVPASLRRRIALRPEAAYFPGDVGPVAVPYDRIVGATPQKKGLELRVEGAPPAFLALPASHAELRLVAAHLDSAARRARGEGRRADDPGERIARLARSPGESVEQWLTRLDGVAATLGSGYRAAELALPDLERAARDIDLSTDLRLAAARVIRRAPGQAGTRIDPATLPSSSVEHAALFRVADGPVDAVARAYEALPEETNDEAARAKGVGARAATV